MSTDGETWPWYLLPLRFDDARQPIEELTDYLRSLSGYCSVLVVDGSPSPLFDRHHRAWAPIATHVPPAPALRSMNGKAHGVNTGMRQVTGELVIIADDDVRYTREGVEAVVAALADADVVVPQNHFAPLPWHAVWDSARTLVNRSFAMDYPGTLGVRRAAFTAVGGYDGDVLFENLELIRTMLAAGRTVRSVPHVLVARRPPTARHFLGQRVRQAYDSFAQPGRFAVELAVLPVVVGAVLTGRWWVPVAVAGLVTGVAERGRRRSGGRAVFPAGTALAAPLWTAERAVCAWLAVGARLRGGVRYRDGRLRRAANSVRRLRDR